jgi:DNA-binding CsgD family transcriptional regulator
LKDDRPRQPKKTAGYKQLVSEFGIGQVADRLLAKWISDEDADEKWEKLSADVAIRYEEEYYVYLKKLTRARRPYKYWVVLWYISMGYSEKKVAEQLELSVNTIKRDLTYARERLDLIGASMPEVVAKAIRLGYIP